MSTIVFLLSMAVVSGPTVCRGPMPAELQWWERGDVTPVAVAVAKRENLKGLYKVLSYHLPLHKACEGRGLEICLPVVDAMRTDIDKYLRKITSEPVDWWGDGSLCWVAAIMVYGDNLEKLRAFIGQQLRRRWSGSPEQIDAYFKKIVNEHSGPLIDRNWNCYK